MRKQVVGGLAVLAAALAGPAALAGTAHAGIFEDGDGTGGTATNNCLNVGVNLIGGIGLGGSGAQNAANCIAGAHGVAD